MSRSLKKGPFVINSLLKKINRISLLNTCAFSILVFLLFILFYFILFNSLIF